MPNKLTIEEMHRIAQKREGICLSSKYVNATTKLRWRCSEGHEWEATPDKVKNSGQWCRLCGYESSAKKRSKEIEAMHEFAASKGAECLSKKYDNAHTKLHWRCNKGHEWEATPDSVLNAGSWCPDCAMERIVSGHQKRRLGIQAMKKIAKDRGGECLSEEYISTGDKLLWRCENGHHWEAVPDSIIGGAWCPTCSAGVSERVCRALFELILESPFPKRRPPWLLNSRGNRMELDGYAENISVAFEYHGKQHFSHNDFFHSSSNDLNMRIEDDKLKVELCQKRGIALFEIPYTVPIGEMQEYILTIIENHNSQASDDRQLEVKFGETINILDLDANSPKYLKEMQELAKSRGGKCVSTVYLNAWSPLSWRCKNGHLFQSPPAQIKNMGHWCPECGTLSRAKASRSRRLGINAMHELAKSKGGTCLSTEYISTDTKLKWQCDKKHVWEAVPSSIKNQGTWCPICGNKRKGQYRKKK